MKLSLDPSASVSRTDTPESEALATWYDANPAIRHMWAIKDAKALRVIVTLEPTVDSDDILPAWLANSQAWLDELRSHTGSIVELELINQPLLGAIETDAEGEVVVAICWRDPAFAFA